jgi:hypothetical protein
MDVEMLDGEQQRIHTPRLQKARFLLHSESNCGCDGANSASYHQANRLTRFAHELDRAQHVVETNRSGCSSRRLFEIELKSLNEVGCGVGP